MEAKSKNELMYVKGVGPKRAEAFMQSGINDIKDLLLYFPRAYIDRSAVSSIAVLKQELADNDFTKKDTLFVNTRLFTEVTIIARVSSKKMNIFAGKRKMLQLNIRDNSSGGARIIFWNAADYFNKVYEEGDLLAISGKPELDSYGFLTFSHPDIDVITPEDEKLYQEGTILPKYRITDNMRKAYISMNLIRQILSNVLTKHIGSVHDEMPEYLRLMHNLPDLQSTIVNLHFPKNKVELERAQYRAKFEEILYYQTAIALRKSKLKSNEKGVLIEGKSALARDLYSALPFEMTNDQKRVLNDIDRDFRSGSPMNRLLQGDVGSGKTIVAIFAMLMAIDAGQQVAFLAPTEILAEQHYHTLKKFINREDIVITQLLGGQKKRMRRDVLENISTGRSNIIVGTHALFSSEIAYSNLGFVIIDEQHRFGVAQRAELVNLAKKSFADEKISPHILVMTATPIPRTLTMTVYGDLDVSVIRELPKNRKPIQTKVAFDNQREDVYSFVRKEIKAGRQAYIVYPLVEKSEKMELKAAVEHFEIIKNEVFPEFRCGLLHGQMFWYEKDEAMNAFLNKEYDILVATTVIEVGIDVPNSTVMVIENAERFGLSQLHQLRGRVGRGEHQSYCILMTKDNFKYLMKKNAGEDERLAAIIRLKTMEETTDGFKVSEVDLKLRGPGDILGTRQAGIPEFKYVDLARDGEVIERAKKTAEAIIADDPGLNKPENSLLRKQLTKIYSGDNSYFSIA